MNAFHKGITKHPTDGNGDFPDLDLVGGGIDAGDRMQTDYVASVYLDKYVGRKDFQDRYQTFFGNVAAFRGLYFTVIARRLNEQDIIQRNGLQPVVAADKERWLLIHGRSSSYRPIWPGGAFSVSRLWSRMFDRQRFGSDRSLVPVREFLQSRFLKSGRVFPHDGLVFY